MNKYDILADNIISVFEKYKMATHKMDQFDSVGKIEFKNKVLNFITKKEPVSFVMLGYPFKSPNHRDKTISSDADMSEEISIKRISSFISEIESIYNPGATFNVASDGYVFNDLLGVENSILECYKEMCLNFAITDKFKIIDLKDMLGNNLTSSRSIVMNEFGISDEQLQHKIMFDVNTNWLYRGMIRFMEEELAVKPFDSRNQKHIAAKKLTKQMMLRNEAFSKLVSSCFSDSIRLSMHQTVNDGKKFSFDLIKDAKHSPWHSVTVINQQTNTSETMHKKDAILMGYIFEGTHFVTSN